MQLQQNDFVSSLSNDFKRGGQAVTRGFSRDLYTEYEQRRDIACSKLGGPAISKRELRFYCKFALETLFYDLDKIRFANVGSDKFYLRDDVISVISRWSGDMPHFAAIRKRVSQHFGTTPDMVFTETELKQNGMYDYCASLPSISGKVVSKSHVPDYKFYDCTSVISGEIAPKQLIISDALSISPHVQITSFAAESETRSLHLARIIFDYGDVMTFRFVDSEFRFECISDGRSRFVHNGVCALLLASWVIGVDIKDLIVANYTPNELQAKSWMLQNTDLRDTCRVSIGVKEWAMIRRGRMQLT